jgi:hypothetical protein
MNGRQLENIMSWIFSLVNFVNVQVNLTNTDLLAKAGGFVKQWEYYYSKKTNRSEQWRHRNQEYILDVIYKLDKIVESCGELYGIQLTLNESALTTKKKQTVERIDLYKSIGLRSVIIIFVNPGDSEGTSSWEPEQLEDVKMQTYDCIIAAEDNLDVGNYITCYTIELP